MSKSRLHQRQTHGKPRRESAPPRAIEEPKTRRTSGRFKIRLSPIAGITRPPLFWTGCGWSATAGEAEVMDVKVADLKLKLMLEDRQLRDTQPGYRLQNGAKLERVLV